MNKAWKTSQARINPKRETHRIGGGVMPAFSPVAQKRNAELLRRVNISTLTNMPSEKLEGRGCPTLCIVDATLGLWDSSLLGHPLFHNQSQLFFFKFFFSFDFLECNSNTETHNLLILHIKKFLFEF